MKNQTDRMMTEELQHLEEVQTFIQEQLDDIENELFISKQEIIDQKNYIWENRSELDSAELASNRVSISEEHNSYEFKEKQKKLLLRLQDNTYFGRIDFIYDGEDVAETIYIGLGSLRSKDDRESIIFDWRAPISSMYYDFDLGNAYYEAPIGKIDGEITQKIQLKIRKGILEYALNSDFKVDDDILQKELSGNGSTKMRNIVATIQKEQNSIVRDQTSTIMLVQGVAGSGKTSIALHRIAFLLYQNRNNINSSEIIIISPNNIFADYISNVLPELDEQNISEVSFDEIAEDEMKGICKYESKYEQMEYIIGCKSEDDNRLQKIRFKSNIIFLEEMKKFVAELESTLMNFSSYKLKDYVFEKDKIESLYWNTFSTSPILERMDKISERIADIYESYENTVVTTATRNKIKWALREMATTTNTIKLYSQFISNLGEKYPLLKNDSIHESHLLYEDVFPVILLNFMLNGRSRSPFDRIKHVIVDEMQDYSMVQYEILHLLFKCKMTILGDINQVVDRTKDSLLDNVQNIFNENVTLIKMLKSYRSTYEISEFCRNLCTLTDAESFERHGKEPSFEECSDYLDMVKSIQEKIDNVDLNTVTTSVVICKSGGAANKLYNALDDEHKHKCYLMNDEYANFHEGIIITNSYLIKGLEFDYVIVPEVTDDEYQTERDRQILYIACTRALHELDILYYGKRSSFLDETLL